MNIELIKILNLKKTDEVNNIWSSPEGWIFRVLGDDVQIRMPSGFQSVFKERFLLNTSKARIYFIMERMANPSIMKRHQTPDQIKNNKLPD